MQEQRAILENETLRKQANQSLSIENHPVDPAIKGGSVSPEIVRNVGLVDEILDTTLQLGHKIQFPGRGTHFHYGDDKYIDSIANIMVLKPQLALYHVQRTGTY
ncbi:putative S-adenosyl-L-methionine-dependent methyltransferase [Forsythia ovata]|uniref:S-adenosyl-L-methionine-dependent methyltransferase n=1 Tax=Forsythia ovata TaxID=205694 RepID=A0ABD1P597_9LAMI